MVDIRTIRGKDKTDAFAKARVEYGGNFVILTSKDVKVGGFLGLGMKTEHELRIMLNNSIYDRKNNSLNSEDKNSDDNEMHKSKLLSDRIEMKKHSADTIDASEMADRIVSITKALKEKSAGRNNNSSNNNADIKKNTYNNENYNIEKELLTENNNKETHERIEDNMKYRNTDNFTPLPHFNNNQYSNFSPSEFGILSDYSLSNSFNNGNILYNHTNSLNNNKNNINNSVDDNVKKLDQQQIRDIVKEYLENSIPNINLNKNISRNSNKSDISEEEEIKNAIEEIKESRREYRERRNHREYADENNIRENKGGIRDCFEDDSKYTCYNDSDTAVSDTMEESFNYLRDREFPEEMLLNLREYLLTSSNARFFQSKDVIREEIEKYFSDRLMLSNGIEIGAKKKIVVFVGPTGVGKTTTIPKIAAQYMKSGKKVSFVTIDNYRIAAVDQLQRYASIMKVPFTSASTSEALRAEIRKMDNSSLLFIDTMGRSPKGAEDIMAMSKYFTAIGRFDMDIQLVMSATAKYKDALKILKGFKPTNYKGVILTKVDETDYLASSICAVIKNKLPITYITHGQGVPKDISAAKKYGYKIIEGLFGELK